MLAFLFFDWNLCQLRRCLLRVLCDASTTHACIPDVLSMRQLLDGGHAAKVLAILLDQRSQLLRLIAFAAIGSQRAIPGIIRLSCKERQGIHRDVILDQHLDVWQRCVSLVCVATMVVVELAEGSVSVHNRSAWQYNLALLQIDDGVSDLGELLT